MAPVRDREMAMVKSHLTEELSRALCSRRASDCLVTETKLCLAKERRACATPAWTLISTDGLASSFRC